jgi:DNA-binding transcriptional ArsR family regulator
VTHPTSLDHVLGALADPTRRAVVDLLRKRRRRAGELADALSISPPALSRHLRVLRKHGLITLDLDEQDARARVYRLCPEPFSELRNWVEEVEQFWSIELAAFKAHAERGRKRAPR